MTRALGTDDLPIITALGSAGRDWVVKSLRSGLSLARAILQVLPPGHHGVYGLVPSGTSHERAVMLDTGGFTGFAERATITVGSLLGARRHGILVAEDELSRPRDPALQRTMCTYPDEIFFCGDEVYHRMEVQAGRPEEVAAFITRSTSGYPANMFLVDGSVDVRRVTAEMDLSGDDIARMSSLVLLVVVGAYDNESYVWCTTDRGKKFLLPDGTFHRPVKKPPTAS